MEEYKVNLTKEQIQRLYDLVDTNADYNEEDELLQDILSDKLDEIEELEDDEDNDF